MYVERISRGELIRYDPGKAWGSGARAFKGVHQRLLPGDQVRWFAMIDLPRGGTLQRHALTEVEAAREFDLLRLIHLGPDRQLNFPEHRQAYWDRVFPDGIDK
jgi:hypothetical protein